MTAHALRREADLARLRELALQSGGRVELLETPARAGRPIRLAIRCRTAGSNGYPQAHQDGVTLRIDLPSRYPFERPVLTVESRIFHPNIFASGVVCQGDKWLPGEGLDLLVKRIIRLVTFEPSHVNPSSAANRAAATWYLQQRSRTPDAFPTDRLAFADPAGAAGATAAAKARAASGGAGGNVVDRVIRRCPACGKGLRLPVGKQGVVACPACRGEFDVTT
jgi:hypothetical protein